ncbi:sulfite exporter TauE/SafE family protein [Siphonobacter curvatus]|uniref:Probable membrane transporter protein n=1 Tax=Siphonobacter curvatus TaxID=2094562 RepID=A0A2S7ILZ0_9BACT|nr:sulfite exporter TauE/SafE family protein [Siphonobacter curvatus]PQA58659.1 permease [Siphonobacter curvatus]
MEIIGFGLAVLIGLLLSLLGGGGSILTVPVLVYIFKLPPSIATAYSLLIVGSASLLGSVDYLRRGLASPRTAVFFSFPSFMMVFISRKYLVPALPEVVIESNGWVVTKSTLMMLLFAVLMVLSAQSMIRGRRERVDTGEEIRKRLNYPLIFVEGLLVGTLTGFVGVGGGFLIIPVLANFVRLPMKLAVGTSLMIIAINSCIGFLGDLGQHTMDWKFLGEFTSLTLLGVVVGTGLSRRIPGQVLKPAFGWFTLLMGTGILLKELVF